MSLAKEMSKQTFRLDGQTVHYTSAVAVMQVFQAAAAHVALRRHYSLLRCFIPLSARRVRSLKRHIARVKEPVQGAREVRGHRLLLV
jgi:hypothetical protein